MIGQYGPNQLHDMSLLEPYKEHDEPLSNEIPGNEKELSSQDAPGNEQQLPAQVQVNDRVDASRSTFCPISNQKLIPFISAVLRGKYHERHLLQE